MGNWRKTPRNTEKHLKAIESLQQLINFDLKYRERHVPAELSRMFADIAESKTAVLDIENSDTLNTLHGWSFEYLPRSKVNESSELQQEILEICFGRISM